MATRRKELDFHSGEEVIAEIESLRENGYERTKNWNLTQICEHLGDTMKGGMDGFGFRLPWLLRATLVKWVFSHALKTRKLLAGAPTLSQLQPESAPGAEDDQVIDDCIATIRRAESFDGPMDDYPLLDNLTPDRWREFMWIHAAHHLGFLIPKR